MPPTSTHNLNAKLPAGLSRGLRGKRHPVSLSQSPIRSSAPPVRIVGVASRYQGGYRVNV